MIISSEGKSQCSIFLLVTHDGIGAITNILAVLGLTEQGRWARLYIILEPKPSGSLMAVGICSFSIGMAIGIPGSEAFYKTVHHYFHRSGHNASPLPSIQRLI